MLGRAIGLTGDLSYGGDGMRPGSRIGAYILIGLGVFFLLSNLGWLPRLGPLMAQWWPLILIIIGILALRKR